MAYQPYRPQGRKAVPALKPGDDLSLEELMAELVRNARQVSVSDAAGGLIGKVRDERRRIRGDETGQ
jgi:hypothetical protein